MNDGDIFEHEGNCCATTAQSMSGLTLTQPSSACGMRWQTCSAPRCLMTRRT